MRILLHVAVALSMWCSPRRVVCFYGMELATSFAFPWSSSVNAKRRCSMCKNRYGSHSCRSGWLSTNYDQSRITSWKQILCRGGSRASLTESISTSATSIHNSTFQDGSYDYSTIFGAPELSTFGNKNYLSTTNITTSGQHRVVFVLGGPGSGKGTQSERIVNEYKCIHLSVGDLLRQERQNEGSKYADLIEKTLVAGKIVPVELSLGLLQNAMNEAAQREDAVGSPIFLVDGFPRNYDNLDGWTRLMPDQACVFGCLVYDCPMKELERRILSRGESSGRSDDNLESARKRFRTYEKETLPIVKILEQYGGNRVSRIAGNHPIEEVWKDTKDAMDSFVLNDVLTATKELLDSVSSMDVQKYLALVDDEMLSSEYMEQKENLSNLSTEQRCGLVFSLEVGESFSAKTQAQTLKVSNVKVEMPTGINAIVTYDRLVQSGDEENFFRETRIWQHKKGGWVNIHFTRIPAP